MRKWRKGLYLAMIFLAGCSSDPTNEELDTNSGETSNRDLVAQENEEISLIDSTDDILIAYFTRPENLEQEPTVEAVSGSSFNVIDNTLIGDVQVITEMIAEQTGGELFSIQTEVGYPNVYDEHTAFATIEVEEDARPMLMADVAQMSDFDVIFIGFPVWWNRAPRAVLTFLEAYDLADKQIIPFATHGGSGLTNSRNELRTLYPDYQFLEGFAVKAGSVEDAEPDLLNWLGELGY